MSMLYVNKGKLQDVADAAALAGAAHIGEEGDGIKHAVEAFAKANGLQVTENELIEVVNDGWSGLSELGDTENVRVAYGVVTVNDRPRLRVRIDKRVLMPFISVLLPDLEKGMPVVAVAAAEGGAMQVPPFRIIGRNGVYDNFFDLSNGDEDETKRWIDGSVYAGNMLRVSYKTKNQNEGKNMFSVNGYIFADRLNTGLPLINGVYQDSDRWGRERIFRSSYVRKKDGENSLYGHEALSPTNTFVPGPGWNCTAAAKAESYLKAYSDELTRLINNNNQEIKRQAMLGVGKNRYMCNEKVYEGLSQDIKSKLHPDRPNTNEWKNKQYSNIDKVADDNKKQREIDTLYVEIQGQSKTHDVAETDNRDAAIWLGAHPYATKIKKIRRIIVELHKTDNETGDNDLTGSFIINLGKNGVMEIGPVYSQANLIVRAAYQGDMNNYIRFTDTVFSEKVLSFSYDDEYAGKGLAHHRFAPEAVLAANLVLFGYGYEIGANVVTPKLENPYNIQTRHYDDLTNYMEGNYEPAVPENSKWWEQGITSIDYVVISQKPIYDLSGLKLSDEADIQKNPYAQEELQQLNELWGCVDKESHEYKLPSKVGGKKIATYDLYGSLYGELGRWPTEIETNVGSDNKRSHIVNCPMESIPGIESMSGKLRLVE